MRHVLGLAATDGDLIGSATDDGLPQGATLSYAWSLAGGPAIPTIATPGHATTSVTFQYPGTYLFRLSVSDTDKTGSAEVSITVNAPSGSKPVVAPRTRTRGSTPTRS
jgi:hypothetical protein